MSSLLERELIVVTGKGGVGRSTVAAALGLASARSGHEAIICESYGQSAVPEMLGHLPPPAGTPLGLADGLSAMSIDPDVVIGEWIGSQVGGTLSRLLGTSKSFGQFTSVVPGLRELLTMTKAWSLGHGRGMKRNDPSYATVVLDAPATGHGVAMLRSPRTFADLATAGPIHGDSMKIWELLRDPNRSAIVAVTLPAELPVAETLDLDRWLVDMLGRPLDAIVVNRCQQDAFSPKDLSLIARTVRKGSIPLEASVVASAASATHSMQEPLIDDLDEGTSAETVVVPEFPADMAVGSVIGEIADLLRLNLG